MRIEHIALRAGRRAIGRHVAISAALLLPAVALAPAKFVGSGLLSMVLVTLLIGAGAASAWAAQRNRALHGIQLPGWSPLDRGWWAWDPPMRAFHWSMCANGIHAVWLMLLLGIIFEVATGSRLPAALAQWLGVGESGAFRAQLVASVVLLAAAMACSYYVVRRWAARPDPIP